MPIVFSSPEPFDPAISSGYGNALQGQQDFSNNLAAAQFAAAQQQRLLAQGTSPDRGPVPAMHGGGHAFGYDMSNPGQGYGGGGGGGGGNPLGALNESALMAQRTYEHGAEMSQQETMQLSRLKNAAGAVQANPNLDQEAKNDLLTQIYTGISPLEAKMQKTRMAQMQQQTQLEIDQHARLQAAEAEAAKFRAKTVEQRLAPLKDPETGETIGYAVEQPGGKTEFHYPPKKEKGTDPAAADAIKAEETARREYRDTLEQATKMVMAQSRETAKDASGNTVTKWPKLAEGPVFDAEVNALHRKMLGYPVTADGSPAPALDTHVATRVARNRGPVAPVDGQRGARPNSLAPGTPGAAGLEAAGRAAEAGDQPAAVTPVQAAGIVDLPPDKTPPPFGKLEDAHPDQKRVYEGFMALKDIAATDPRVPDQSRAMYAAQAETAAGLLKEFGSVQRMQKDAPDKLRLYLAIRESLQRMQQLQKPAPPPSPRPAPGGTADLAGSPWGM